MDQQIKQWLDDVSKGKPLGDSTLAQLMLDWEKQQLKADLMAQVIKDQVLLKGESVTTGAVVATYNSPRKRYDYEQVGAGADAEVIGQYTTVSAPRVDWRKLCLDGLGLRQDDIAYTEGAPSVSLKIKGG